MDRAVGTLLFLLLAGLAALAARAAWRGVERYQLAWYCRVHGVQHPDELSTFWRRQARGLRYWVTGFLALASLALLVSSLRLLLHAE